MEFWGFSDEKALTIGIAWEETTPVGLCAKSAAGTFTVLEKKEWINVQHQNFLYS